jgi:hypothetical protein
MRDVVLMLLPFSIGLAFGVNLMVWAHDNKRLRYRDGC